MKKRVLNVGIIGAGNFGEFLINAYSPLKEIKITAISSKDPSVKILAKKYNIPFATKNYKKILKDPKIDIVIIATPPFLHAKMSIDAINTGKHVISEKPLATKLSDAKKIKQALDKNKKVLFTIDYIIRKNPLIQKVKQIIDKKIFGEIQNINFENYAGDSQLDKNHWFWNKKLSGGIWVEHGVHFFDLFRYITSQQPIKISAFSVKRNKKTEDEVSALLLYNKGILANITHSFTKPGNIEHTSFTISFDRGELKIEGWIPEELTVSGVVNDIEYSKLKKIIDVKAKTRKGQTLGRWKKHKISKEISSNTKIKQEKQEIYKESARGIMKDLINAINKKTKLSIDYSAAYNSLKDAINANKNTTYSNTL